MYLYCCRRRRGAEHIVGCSVFCFGGWERTMERPFQWQASPDSAAVTIGLRCLKLIFRCNEVRNLPKSFICFSDDTMVYHTSQGTTAGLRRYRKPRARHSLNEHRLPPGPVPYISVPQIIQQQNPQSRNLRVAQLEWCYRPWSCTPSQRPLY